MIMAHMVRRTAGSEQPSGRMTRKNAVLEHASSINMASGLERRPQATLVRLRSPPLMPRTCRDGRPSQQRTSAAGKPTLESRRVLQGYRCRRGEEVHYGARPGGARTMRLPTAVPLQSCRLICLIACGGKCAALM